MKNILIKIICFVICAVMLFSFTSCAKKGEEISIVELMPDGKLSDGEGIENERYSLVWNDTEKCLVFEDKKELAKWSTTPIPFLEQEEKPARIKNYLQSPIIVSYFDNREGIQEAAVARGYTDCIKGADFAIEKGQNAITISYYFEDIDAIIPVIYTLRKDGVSISVDANEIVEGKSPIHKISLAPYFCSVKTGTEDSYLFYPSGTGAIIDTSNSNLFEATYSSGIYGDDAARKIKEKLTNTKNNYIPVFGSVVGNSAICGVVSSGEGCAELTVSTADSVTGYSNIGVDFYVRGYDYNSIKINQSTIETSIFAEDPVKDVTFTVDFYPLYNEEASYVGMAKLYQNILYGNNDAVQGVEDEVYALKFFGGLMEQRNFLGFPYKRLLAATTYKDISKILTDLEVTNQTPNIQLYGFGQSGADVNKIAGGYKLGNAFGKKKDLKSLINYCTEKGIDSFVDFDIISYNTSNTFASAKTGNKQLAYQYYVGKGAQQQTTATYDRYRLLRLDTVKKAANKLVKKIDKYNLTGISFSTLSSVAYSDYASSEYHIRRNYREVAQQIIKTYKDSGYNFAANGANAYAATLADCILEAPLNSNKCDFFTANVPFYQMVFKGKTEIASEAVNAGEELWKKQLQCLESGSSMLFTICDKYDSVLAFSQHKGLYGSVYEDNKQSIISSCEKYGDFYDAVSNTTIKNHEVLTQQVRCTTFANGVKIYVNYSDADYTTADGVVTARNCLIVK